MSTIPTGVRLERRSSALYSARTHTIKGTLLSDAAKTELCEAFIDLRSDFNAQGEALERAVAELERLRLELAPTAPPVQLFARGRTAKCGTRSRYVMGCRCQPCVTANRTAEQARYQRRKSA